MNDEAVTEGYFAELKGAIDAGSPFLTGDARYYWAKSIFASVLIIGDEEYKRWFALKFRDSLSLKSRLFDKHLMEIYRHTGGGGELFLDKYYPKLDKVEMVKFKANVSSDVSSLNNYEKQCLLMNYSIEGKFDQVLGMMEPDLFSDEKYRLFEVVIATSIIAKFYNNTKYLEQLLECMRPFVGTEKGFVTDLIIGFGGRSPWTGFPYQNY